MEQAGVCSTHEAGQRLTPTSSEPTRTRSRVGSTGPDRRTRLDRTGLDRAGLDRAEGETDRATSYPRDRATSYPQAQKNPATGAGSRLGRLSEDGQPELVCDREQPEGDHDPNQSLNPEGYLFAVHRSSPHRGQSQLQ